MPHDPHSTAPMPELPRGTPNLDVNTVPPMSDPRDEVSPSATPGPERFANDENAEMLLSQFSFEQLLNELMRRRGQE